MSSVSVPASPPSSPRRSGVVVSRPHPPQLEAFGVSHPGIVRRHNEDTYLVRHATGLFVVADGMGGAAAGEVASRMAVEAVAAFIADPDITWPTGSAPRAPAPGLPLLIASVELANARVHAAATADRRKAGMGTTLIGALVLEGRVALAHVGDSRAYLLRGRRLDPLTEDHTIVNELLRAGVMMKEAAQTSEVRHVLSRAIGTEASVEVDARHVRVEAGDTLLLCSDGLHGVVGDEDITAILLAERDLTRAAARLVERANDAGGPDNITAVLIRIA